MAAEALIAPRKAYLEFALHPANSIPYTPKDDRVKVYKTPIEKSDITNP